MKSEDKQTIQMDFSKMARPELENYAMEKTTQVVTLETRLEYYEEQLRKNRHKMYGASSEKNIPGQINFFNEPEQEENPAQPEPTEEDIEVKPAAIKSKGRKKAVTRELENEVIEYTLSAEEQACPKCGGELTEMKTVVREEIVYIPMKYKRLSHITHIYSCRDCDRDGVEGTIISAPSPNGMFRNSLASPSFVADIIKKKYILAQPLYRQEKELQRLGLNLGRNTLANWVINASRTYLSLLYEHMKKQLLGSGVIMADETPLQVLHEPGREATTKSYMWAYRSGACEDKKVTLFAYSPGRGKEYPMEFLGDYSGYIQCDGYAAYRAIAKDDTGPPYITLSACWAHARRKYTDILNGLPENVAGKDTATKTAITLIGKLFSFEEKLKNSSASADERKAYRREHALPVVDEYFSWAKSIAPMCSGSISKAIAYSLNLESELRAYLDDGRLEISNNLTENAIRPFAIGRKNWLFADTVKGAHSSSICYSIIETAKANGLDVFEYFKYIFETLKDADLSLFNLETIMPWSDSLPSYCLTPAERKKRA